MRYRTRIAAMAVAGLSLLAMSVVGGAKEAAPPPGSLARAHLAATLADYGIANHDPATLLAAAHLINGLKANVAKMHGTRAHQSSGKPVAVYDPLELLKLAKLYAVGHEASLTSAIDAEMHNVSSTQATCRYDDYCTLDDPPYCWQEYFCF